LSVNVDDDWFFLIDRGFDISLRKLHNDSGFSCWAKGIDQTERGKEEYEHI
jgi:hypothetical protein